MDIKKFGETFNVTDVKETYKISGDLIKTVDGNVIINVGTTTLEDEHISNLNGDYFITDNTLNYTFRTYINTYDTQKEVIDLVIDAVKEILK